MHQKHAAILQTLAEDLGSCDEGPADERHRAHAVSLILRKLASELLFDAEPASAELRLVGTIGGQPAPAARI